MLNKSTGKGRKPRYNWALPLGLEDSFKSSVPGLQYDPLLNILLPTCVP